MNYNSQLGIVYRDSLVSHLTPSSAASSPARPTTNPRRATSTTHAHPTVRSRTLEGDCTVYFEFTSRARFPSTISLHFLHQDIGVEILQSTRKSRRKAWDWLVEFDARSGHETFLSGLPSRQRDVMIKEVQNNFDLVPGRTSFLKSRAQATLVQKHLKRFNEYLSESGLLKCQAEHQSKTAIIADGLLHLHAITEAWERSSILAFRYSSGAITNRRFNLMLAIANSRRASERSSLVPVQATLILPQRYHVDRTRLVLSSYIHGDSRYRTKQ
ncbi:hypothetical protein FHL15_004857 [Xylaria flabelliformis]|uniref:Uncharacterized protein n=1 Tax=Xylaria flabelliformis TaxID=2512241 RepID=A0A553I2F7_9PEZI|nr:hypothetical protein FHL15_004857 [Xylaria flabelliformis]